MSSRPCGITYTPKNNAYKLEELIQMALDKKLIRSANEGRKLKLQGLCEILGIPLALAAAPVFQKIDTVAESKNKCRAMSKADILKKEATRLQELNVTELEADSMSKEELCDLLYPTIKKDFSITNCSKYTKQDFTNYSRVYAVPINDTMDANEKCKRLNDSINEVYNSNPSSNFKASDCETSPSGKVKLQPYQSSVVKHLLNHRSCLAVHDVGTGKTMIAAGAIDCLTRKFPHLRVLVLTPSSLKNNFIENMTRYGIPQNKFEIYSFDEYFAFFVRTQSNPMCSNTFVIIDEAHNLRALTGGIQSITKSKRAYAIMKCVAQCFRVLLLTATPIVNGEEDLINLKMMLDGFSPEPENRITEKQMNRLIENPASFVQEFKCKVSVYMPTRDLALYPQVIKEPIIYFQMTDDYYSKYKSIENKAADPAVLLTIGTLSNKSSFYANLRRAVNALDELNNPKVKWILEKVLSDAKLGKKSVIYSNWLTAGMNILRTALDKQTDFNYAYISGEMDLNVKTQFVNAYNKGTAPILLISKAGAEGLNLIETRNLILMESNWNSATDDQIIGRAVRMNSHINLPTSERNVTIYRLMMKKPVYATDKLKAIDEELYEISYVIKKPKMDRALDLLKASSIDAASCKCKKEKDGTCLYEGSKMQMEKGKVTKEQKVAIDLFTYKTEASSLVQPEKVSEKLYERLASVEESTDLEVPPAKRVFADISFSDFDDILDDILEGEEEAEQEEQKSSPPLAPLPPVITVLSETEPEMEVLPETEPEMEVEVRSESPIPPPPPFEPMNIHYRVSQNLDSVQPFFRVIPSDYPKMPYDYKDVTYNCHWGQRKLFFSEWEFLTKVSSSLKLNTCTVVYIGAAEGSHIAILRKYFPEVKWILYDPNPFKLEADPKFIDIHTGEGGYFTDEEVSVVLQHPFVQQSPNILFISDIRRTTDESKVFEDMLAQQAWGVNLKSKFMLLKFRPPYNIPTEQSFTNYPLPQGCIAPANPSPSDKSLLYLKGDVLIQIWAPIHSTESRLLVQANADGTYDMAYYDYATYEDQMFYFNKIGRKQRFALQEDPSISAIVPHHIAGFDESYECVAEILMIINYLRSTGQSTSHQAIISLLQSVNRQLEKTHKRNLIECVHTSVGKKGKSKTLLESKQLDYTDAIQAQIDAIQFESENNPLLTPEAYNYELQILSLAKKRLIK